jgi:hypothetical protein
MRYKVGLFPLMLFRLMLFRLMLFLLMLFLLMLFLVICSSKPIDFGLMDAYPMVVHKQPNLPAS